MVLGERVKDPLKHEMRYHLLNIILKYKRTGIRLVELSKITGKKNHSLRHHLDILEKKKLVYSKSDTHQLYYFPDPHIPKHTRIGHPLENELRSKMLETILAAENKGVNLSVLHRKLKASKNNTLKSLRILDYFDLIHIEQGGNRTSCYSTLKSRDLLKYIKEKMELLEAIKEENGMLMKDLRDKIDIIGLSYFKLCIYIRRHGRETLYYLTPFVESVLKKYSA
jgi:predicted transcriptional regulator